MIADLSSYEISDFLLFSKPVLFQIFETYNKTIWPLPLIWILVSFLLVFLMTSKRVSYRDKLTSGIVSLAWLFSGGLFHFKYFLPINWSAKYFGSLFLLEGALIFIFGVLLSKIHFESPKSLKQRLGILIFFLSAFIPAMSLIGLSFSQSQMFGWGTEMTALGTVGIILAARWSWAHLILLLPSLLWCLISSLMYYGLR